MANAIKLAVCGATGRMGRTVVRLCQESDDLTLVGACSASGDPHLGEDAGTLAGVGTLGVAVTDDMAAALLGADVVVDFSLPAALGELTRLAARQKVALVSGTTGVKDTSPLDQAAAFIPVLWAANMSLGIQVLSELAAEAARRLGPGFDIEITEVHHKKKVDAPSGTAVRIGEAIREVRPLRPVAGRDGIVGARPDDELGMFALRGGDVIGDHTVYLFGPGERLELTHRATSRDLFALGALRAARWIAGKPARRYTLSDVLHG
ncbi:MAG TPA: 4-hydroxy-tetrahydrodipicolinate reductase [Polyangiaceae bacterium]|nr:4-hydroxy-tetrahydrodipicolinate reductase [Polyangiaceae bacterium]